MASNLLFVCLLPVAMPGARPGAPSSVLAPSSDGLQPAFHPGFDDSRTREEPKRPLPGGWGASSLATEAEPRWQTL